MGAQSEAPPPPPDASARLTALRERIDALQARHAPASGPSLRDIERRIGRPDEAPRNPAPLHERRPAPLSAAAAADEERDALGNRLSGYASRLFDPSRTRGATAERPQALEQQRSDLEAAINEIVSRQRFIDGETRASSRPAPLEDEARTREMDAVAAALADLRKAVGGLSRGGTRSADSDAFTAIARRLDAQEARLASDDDRIGALGDQIADLREALDSTASEAALSTLEAGYAHIIERLDLLARRLPDQNRLDALAGEIDRLSQRLAAFDRPGPESLLGELNARLDTLQSLGGELAQIRLAMKGLYNLTSEAEDPGVQRVEQRLADLSARLEASLAEAPRADLVADLLERLDEIVARLEPVADQRHEPSAAVLETMAGEIAALRRIHAESARTLAAGIDRQIEALAVRLDAVTPLDLPATLADLERQMAALARRLETGLADPRSQEQLDRLERQVGALADRLEQAEPTRDSIEELERQVGALAARLEDTGAVPAAFGDVERNLRRLEGALADTRRESLDAVQAAARDAVRELADTLGRRPDDTPLVAALKEDLRRLQDAAEDNQQRSHETLEAVHDTLDQIVRRLARLEDETRQGPSAGDDLPRHLARRRETSGWSRTATAEPEDYRPLEPGSGRPPPAAERAADIRDRKADFIAAARRAAQAAAAETAAGRSSAPAEPPDDKGGPLSRLGRALRGRNSLVMAAAAIVLAIAAVRFLGGDTAPEQVAATPAATGETGAVPAFLDTPSAQPDTTRDAAAAARPPAGPGGDALAFGPPQLPAARFHLRPMPTADALVGRFQAVDDSIEVEGGMGGPLEDLSGPVPPIGPQSLKEAAAAGDAAALFEVASRYAEGRDAPRDLAAAATWYERAAEQGLALAQYRLGNLYERGQGVAADRGMALGWYRRAAEQGNVQAMHNLAVLLGEGASADPAGALRWFTAAAEHGVKDSQYNLGVIYARGIGTAQDLVQSYKWFALAAAQGDTDAGARRDAVAAALTASQIAAARAAVSAFHPRTPLAAANSVATPDGGRA